MKIMKKIEANFKDGEIADKRKNVTDNPNALKNYGVERMMIDRGSCLLCKEKFEMHDVIVMRIVLKRQTESKYNRDVKWNHVECFAEKREFLCYRLSGSRLPGFKELDEVDQTFVRTLLP